MDRALLIGKQVRNIRYGSGTIVDIRNTILKSSTFTASSNMKYEGVFVLFKSQEDKITFRFPDAFYMPKNDIGLSFVDKTDMDILNESFFMDYYSGFQEISKMVPEKLQCRRCGKLRLYTVEEQIEFYKKSGKDKPLCPECRSFLKQQKINQQKKQGISDKEMNFFKKLMSHPNPRKSKGSWIHNTDGMHID